MLDQAIALVDQLNPSTEIDPKVTRLSPPEKLVLGQQASDALGALAYQQAPAQTLAKLDAQGAMDERSHAAATALLQRVSQGR
jgi:hypothetical protein